MCGYAVVTLSCYLKKKRNTVFYLISNTEKIHNATKSAVLFDELRRVLHCDERLLRVTQNDFKPRDVLSRFLQRSCVKELSL